MGRLCRIRNFYTPWLARETQSAKQVAWDGPYQQYRRFEIFIEQIDLRGKRLLDVGSGTGDLYDYLNKRAIDVDYTGVDILAEMVKCSSQRFPNTRFIHADIFKSRLDEPFDVVLASGTFSLDLGNNAAFLTRVIDRFSELATHAFAFNLLHELSPRREKSYFYTSPDALRPLLDAYPFKTHIVDDYLDNDLTVIGNLA